MGVPSMRKRLKFLHRQVGSWIVPRIFSPHSLPAKTDLARVIGLAPPAVSRISSAERLASDALSLPPGLDLKVAPIWEGLAPITMAMVLQLWCRPLITVVTTDIWATVAAWAAAVSFHSVPETGSVETRFVVITTSPRMCAVFDVVLAVLVLLLSPTLAIPLAWTTHPNTA
jgi:hypothetical protein